MASISNVSYTTGSTAHVTGTDQPGTTVTVSGGGSSVTVTTDAHGNWSADLTIADPSQDNTISASSNNGTYGSTKVLAKRDSQPPINNP